MAARELIQIGDPRLKSKNRAVISFDDQKTKQVINDLIDTVRSKDLVIGMSAPQIGENYKIFITEPRKTKFRSDSRVDELRVYVNPTIVNYSAEKVIIYEGCGSLLEGQLFGPVERSREITVEALGRKGKKFRLTCDGILARVILHEFDHLNGIEFIEKVHDYGKLMVAEFYLKNIKGSEEQLKASEITKKEVEFLLE